MNNNNITISDEALSTSDILMNYGGLHANNLLSLLDSENVFSVKQSLYHNIKKLESFLRLHNDDFCILSMNIQSIRAKFPELQVILQGLRNKSLYFDCLCLQETWLNSESNYYLFNLDGYRLIKKDFEDNCSRFTA